MNRTLVTQTAIQPILAALNEGAANLAAHANASLSKAHGINLLQFAPNSVADENGNDISVYYDDHGDVIGNAFVVFSINNTVYYAPANVTTLAPQPPNSGQGTYGPDQPSTPPGTNSAWITSSITEDAAAVDSINDDVMLPHTQLGYWEAHDNMTAFAQNTYDSIGHLIGNYVVNFYWGGNAYQIPCADQLGGISQSPWSFPFTPVISAYWAVGPDDNAHVFNYHVYAQQNSPGGTAPWCQIGGRLPLTVNWYVQDVTGAWNLVSGGPVTVPYSNAAGSTVIIYASSDSFTFSQEASIVTTGLTRILNVKCTVTNPEGTLDPAGLFTFTVFKNPNY